MANIKIVVNPINVTNYVIIEIERVDNLGVEVDRQSFAPPHTQRNITFPDLDPVMYRFFFWESADGNTLDTVIGAADIDGSIAFDQVITLYEFVADGIEANDPVSGQDEYNNADLADATPLVPGITGDGAVYLVYHGGLLVQTALFENIVTGGFRLLDGDLFYSGDRWAIVKYRKVVSQTVASNAVWPADLVIIEDLSTNIVTATHFNKELEFVGAFDVQKAIFPNLATVPDRKYMLINTHRFTGKYVELDFTAGGGVWYENELVNKFWIPASKEFSFTIKAGVARIIASSLSPRGLPCAEYKLRPYQIAADGTEYTQAEAPGLYDFVTSLPAGVAVSFAQWNSSVVIDGVAEFQYKGCFAIDPGSLSIKVPDLRDRSTRYLKAVDATRTPNTPGGLQLDGVGSFTATVTVVKGYSYTNAPNNDKVGNGNNNPENKIQSGPWTFNTGKTETTVNNVGLIAAINL